MTETSKIALESVVSQQQGLLSNALSDSEMVLLDIDRGSYFGMESVAKRIWDALREPITVSDLCEKLLASYNVDRATCRREVLDFLIELERQGLLVTSPSENGATG